MFRGIPNSYPHNQHISPTIPPIQRRKTTLRGSWQRQPRINDGETQLLQVISPLPSSLRR